MSKIQKMKSPGKFGDTVFLTTKYSERKELVNRKQYVIFIACILILFCALSMWWFMIGPLHGCSHLPQQKPVVAPVCSGIPDFQKFDCYPDSPVTEAQCLSRGCCYAVPKNVYSEESLPPLNIPYCYYPSNYVGYQIIEVQRSSRRFHIELKRFQPSGFPKDVKNVVISIIFIDDNILRIKISDADSARYEVPIPLYYQTKELKALKYNVNINSESGLLQVIRVSTGKPIFSTNLSRLVFSDQLLQLSSELPSTYVYGIGEHYGSLLRNVNWTRFTLINSDQAPIPNHGLYGSHPFYMTLDEKGHANGVFLFNSNIMDVILQPTPAITFRPIGGIFDFFLMLGPKPSNVTQQYSSIVGRTFMPPFWSLGFHLCRYGYKTLNKTKETMERNIDAGIPLDVQWNDIDYMDRYRDFTYDKENFAGLPEFIDDLHNRGMHYVMMTDPGISSSDKDYSPYDEGMDEDIFIKNANGSIFAGKVWTDGTTAFPDFSHPAAASYWQRQFQKLYDDVRFDGVWIDMNEPSNFYDGEKNGCPKSPLENPQYVPGGNTLYTKTVCMSAKHYHSVHYNEHNIYGYQEAVATNKAVVNIRKRRPFIISRASFPGQGVYSGHWSGDVFSTWEDMRYTIPSMINFNMFALPMVGSDICGFNGNTTVELCARWQTLGAFYPFSRNHNERVTIEQDPAALGRIVIEAAQNGLSNKYSLLPYLYTLFYRSHAFGEMVIRPLFFEFPNDTKTYGIDEQFLWGPAIMIVPVLYPNTTLVDAYFPKGLWFDKFGSVTNSTGEKISLNIPLTEIYLSVRAGYIIPAIVAEQTTTKMRSNPFMLSVGLDEQGKASGELYWDDGDSLDTYENGFYNLIQFEAVTGALKSNIVNNGYNTQMKLIQILVANYGAPVTNVTVNGTPCSVFQDMSSLDNKSKGKFEFLKVDRDPAKVDIEADACRFFLAKELLFIDTPASLLSDLSVTWN